MFAHGSAPAELSRKSLSQTSKNAPDAQRQLHASQLSGKPGTPLGSRIGGPTNQQRATRHAGSAGHSQRRAGRGRQRQARTIFGNHQHGPGARHWSGDSPLVVCCAGPASFSHQRKNKKRSRLPGSEIQKLPQRRLRGAGIHRASPRVLAHAEPSIDGLKLDANRLQEQLPSLLSADRKQSEGAPAASVVPPSRQELGDAAAKIFDMATEESAAAKMETPPVKSDASLLAHTPKSAKSPATSSFDDEEVKIPAWLEPLARNAAIPAPASEKGASDSGAEFEERQAPEAVEPAPAPKHVAATAKKTARATRYTKAAPLFGNSLLGESRPEVTSPRRRGKGIWMGRAAGLIVAASSGAWYFRDSLASLAPARAESESNTSPASSARPASLETAPPVNSAALATPSLRPNAAPDASSPVKKENSASAMTEAPASVSSPALGKVQAAAITERVPKSGSNNDIFNEPAKSAEPVEPEITRPSLGKVRLAKPKVRRSASVQANGEIEPALEVSSDGAFAAGETSLGANLAESSKQPAAPALLVGGDVKPAHLISSVPPSYPAMAKSQHVAGDVRVDALIDATGRVTTMKVVSGPSLLHQAAMEALRQWKYQAATLDGKAVPMHLTVTIQFRLQ